MSIVLTQEVQLSNDELSEIGKLATSGLRSASIRKNKGGKTRLVARGKELPRQEQRHPLVKVYETAASAFSDGPHDNSIEGAIEIDLSYWPEQIVCVFFRDKDSGPAPTRSSSSAPLFSPRKAMVRMSLSKLDRIALEYLQRKGVRRVKAEYLCRGWDHPVSVRRLRSLGAPIAQGVIAMGMFQAKAKEVVAKSGENRMAGNWGVVCFEFEPAYGKLSITIHHHSPPESYSHCHFTLDL